MCALFFSAWYSCRMFSLTTTLFYMLSAYIAFLIGSSPELSPYFIVLVPFGFVVGYLLDRFNSVKALWVEDRAKLIKLVAAKYVFFILVTGVFFGAGLLFGDYFFGE